MEHFPILILIGRPASGKSEIIDYLEQCDPEERLERFRIGELDVLDDFPIVWSWFEEDDILQDKFGKPRIYTDEGGYFTHQYFWNLLIERLSLEYHKRTRDQPDYHRRYTTIFEFARGSEHGGYMEAFEHLSDEILRKAGVVYVNVSYKESLRKNRRRFNPNRPDSILEHALPDVKLERLYSADDWVPLSEPDDNYMNIGNYRTPYAVFENEDDITSGNLSAMARRLEHVFIHLASLYTS